MIFHATDNANYEGIREKGLVLEATRASWQRHRLAIHFVYAGGVTSPGPGTVIKYGPYVFYCNLHRLAIHFVYAGGVTSPGPGTVIKYGPYVFYCNLDYESYLKSWP
eukprot:s6932_g7.t1